MTSRPLVFTDLDDSLFQTLRKIASADRCGLTAAAHAGDGDAAKTSWMTVRQAGLLAWLRETAEVVPVTARSTESFARTRLGLDGWAVLGNGALILEPGGMPHGPWADRMRAVLEPARPALERLLLAGRTAARQRGLDIRSWIVEDEGLASYVVFKLNEPVGDTGALAALELGSGGVDLSGWVRHANGNNLSLIPPGSGKRPAVEYLRRMLDPDGSRPVLALADSLSDLDFVAATDLAVIPLDSQIARERLAP